MFDLNQAIDNWHEQLTHEPMNETDLIELEDHLRSEINDLTCRGLTEEEAFIMAKHRLGEDHSLAKEYVKSNPWPKWRQRFFWGLAGIIGFHIIGSIATTISNAASLAALSLGVNNGTYLGIIQSIIHLFALVAILTVTIIILSQSRISARHFRNTGSIITLCMMILVIFVGSKLLGFGGMIFRAKMMGVESIGSMAMVQHYSSMVLMILQPIIMVIALLILWPRKKTTTV